MKFDKKAFTLTELLIAMGVIGVLAAVLMPIISNMLPDQNAIMAKRAYYSVQNVVSDMINNGDCYPDTSKAASNSFRRIGFDDGFRYPNCEYWQGSPYFSYVCQDEDNDGECDLNAEGKPIIVHNDGDPNEGDASKKFGNIFKNTLDLKSADNVNTKFSTKDGIDWQFSNLNHFNTKNYPNPNACAIIYIDVNGSKGPNRRDTGANLSNIFGRPIQILAYDEDNPATYDVFSVDVCVDGRINVRDEWAKKVIEVDYDIQGK